MMPFAISKVLKAVLLIDVSYVTVCF